MERTYKKIEIVGISETSFGEATQNAVAKAVSHSAMSTGSRDGSGALVEKDKVKEFQIRD